MNETISRDRQALVVGTIAVLVLTVMDSLIKLLSPRFDALQLMMLRQGTGLIFAAIVFAVMRPGWPARHQIRGHIVRISLMLVCGLLFFHALGRMPLAELFIYTFTAPMFVAVFGTLMLRERPSMPVVGGIAVGFSGILLIVLTDPDLMNAAARTETWDGRAAALLSPVLYGVALTLLRQQAMQEPAARIAMMQPIVALVLLTPFVAWRMPVPSPSDAGVALIIGALGVTGNLLLTKAYGMAQAAKVAVTDYTGLIWAAMIGYAFFAEVPRSMVWAGGGLVIVGCLVVARAEELKRGAAPSVP